MLSVAVLSIDVLGNDSYAVELRANMNRARLAQLLTFADTLTTSSSNRHPL